ncbi:MAG TPA: alpha/beta hydrolase-fold protein [Thermoanaerobaculia bacterium]|nr:alpha/beta hydrolase-fold protein [Thermoanaerobaculia bacterium]
MKEEYLRWSTPYLGGRIFEMLVFGHAGFPVVLFPTSRARYYEYKDFGLIEAARPLLEAGRVKIYCPDSIDGESWYNHGIHPADRVKTHIAYERVIVRQVFAHARIDTGRPRVAVGGCSFGAYHALNVALRHPDQVAYLLSMSGAFDIRQFLQGYYDDDCYFNNPVDYLPGLHDPWHLGHLRQMGIVLGVGEWDICLEPNLALSRLLESKGLVHWLDLWRWAKHDWPLWRDMFPRYLSRL